MTAPPDTMGSVLRDGFRLIGRFVRARPWSFSLAVGGALVFASAIVLAAFVVGRVTDELIIPVLEGNEPLGNRWVGAVGAVFAVSAWKAGGIVLRRTAAGWLQFGTQADVRYRLVEHQMGLELRWFSSQSTGDLLSVSETDARQGTFILAPLPFGTGSTLLLLGSVVIIFLIDWVLGLITLGVVAAVIVIDVIGSWATFSAFGVVQESRGAVSDVAHESFDGALTVKALGREAHETRRLQGASERLRDDLVTVARLWTLNRAIVEAIPAIATLSLVIVGAVRIRSGAITPGDLVTVAYLVSLLTLPIFMLWFVLWDMAHSLAGWRRVERVLDVDDRVRHGATTADDGGTGARVEGDRVGFSYDGDASILSDLAVDVPAGRTVAVVGPTGSGKSTFSMLLARLWDPTSGVVHLDGRDLRDFARSELPREVAYVAQEAFLFDDDVAGNITLGLDVDHDRVEDAARMAGAHEFVLALPHGYRTRLGERGTTLSGGQRQRIALARALARRPRLLVLDDATSAVDPSVEAEILRGLKRAELPSTVIIVAHRRSSIVLADEILFLDEGRIVDHGSHEELLERQPGYARLLQAYDEDAALRERAGRVVSESTAPTRTALIRVLRMVPSLRRGLAVTLLLVVLGTTMQLVVPVIVQQILDGEILDVGGVDIAGVVRLGLVGVAGVIGAALAARTAQLRLAITAAHGLSDLRVMAFEHLHRLSILHVQTERRGALVSRVTSDIATIQDFMDFGGMMMLVGSAQVTLAVVLMSIYQWQLALVVVLGVIVYAALLAWFQKILARAHDRVRERVADSLSALSEAITGLPAVRAYGAERSTLRRLRTALDRQFASEFRTGRLGAVLFSSAELFAGAITATVIGVGVWLGAGAGVTAGTLVAFLFLVNLLVGPIQILVETLDSAQTAGAGVRRILRVLDTRIEIADPVGGAPLPAGGIDVAVEHLRYRYPGTDVDVVTDVDLEIAAGTRVAIVGETGSGKTTFAKLVTRLLDPTDGRIVLSGIPLDRIPFSSLRSRLAYVPQEGFLFDATIGDNVRYGRPEASDAEIGQAFTDLDLEGWVTSLPAGLDTPVGERGGQLSAGERQLVAVVRAWIADPDLLVLDEATSAVDPALEVSLRRAIERLTEGRTSLTVAHRLSTAEASDDVLVFDAGRLVERGRHDDLVAADGVYAGLYADWSAGTAAA